MPFRLLIACFAFVALAVPSARADDITVTSGSVIIASGIAPPGTVSVHGTDGFSFVAGLNGTGLPLATGCGPGTPCGPGATLPLAASWSGLDIRNGVVTLDGVTYTDVGGLNSPNQLVFNLLGTATAPSFNGAQSATVTAPFTLSGFFVSPNGQANLLGGGLATLMLDRNAASPDSWNYDGIRYDFGATNNVATPEPASLILLGTGLALVVGRRLRKRSRASS